MPSAEPLTSDVVEAILARVPSLTIGVLGDLFLDRYLDLDATLTEPSLETGLPAYQVTRVRSSPGAAGTILNNLVALGVGRVCPVSVIGDDGEGYELRQALAAMRPVDGIGVVANPDRRTPTYTKPMLHEPGRQSRELNRLDIKNRTPLPHALEQQVLDRLNRLLPDVDALLVLDQVSEEDCGVVTAAVRQRLADWAADAPGCAILADSRERIGLFRGVMLKPNRRECLLATGRKEDDQADLQIALKELAQHAGRPVLCTTGEDGILLADPGRTNAPPTCVPAYPVTGPIDVVGAGDSTSAGIACALAGGAALEQAAAFGNLVASITIQQLGTTGTASPEQVRQRWQRVAGANP